MSNRDIRGSQIVRKMSMKMRKYNSAYYIHDVRSVARFAGFTGTPPKNVQLLKRIFITVFDLP